MANQKVKIEQDKVKRIAWHYGKKNKQDLQDHLRNSIMYGLGYYFEWPNKWIKRD